MHESKRQSLCVDQYAQLQDIAREAGSDVLILPGGGHEQLEEYLTCKRCGRFVCYRHNPGIKPGYREPSVSIPLPEGNFWSRPIPEKLVRKFSDQLVVVPGI